LELYSKKEWYSWALGQYFIDLFVWKKYFNRSSKHFFQSVHLYLPSTLMDNNREALSVHIVPPSASPQIEAILIKTEALRKYAETEVIIRLRPAVSVVTSGRCSVSTLKSIGDDYSAALLLEWHGKVQSFRAVFTQLPLFRTIIPFASDAHVLSDF
jgi:hypothetical protein